MVIKLTEEIEESSEDYGKLWFYDKRNIIDSIPNLVGFSENKIKLRVKAFLFLDKIVEFEIASSVGGGYIEHKFKNEDSFGTLLITFNKNRKIISLSLSYSGKFEKQMKKIFEEMMKNLKRKYFEQKALLQKRSNESLSSRLTSLSFIAKIISTSKLIYSDRLDTGKTDMSPYIENLLHKFSQYPVIYISGFNEESVFRLLFVKGELKGVYVKTPDNEFYSEEGLLKLKGAFHVAVYANLLKVDMVV